MSELSIEELLQRVRERIEKADARADKAILELKRMQESATTWNQSRLVERLKALAWKRATVLPKGLARHVQKNGLTAEEVKDAFGEYLEKYKKHHVQEWVLDILFHSSSYAEPFSPPEEAYALGWSIADIKMYFTFTNLVKMKDFGYPVEKVFEAFDITTSNKTKLEVICRYGAVETAKNVPYKQWNKFITPDLRSQMRQGVTPLEFVCKNTVGDEVDEAFLLNDMQYSISDLQKHFKTKDILGQGDYDFFEVASADTKVEIIRSLQLKYIVKKVPFTRWKEVVPEDLKLKMRQEFSPKDYYKCNYRDSNLADFLMNCMQYDYADLKNMFKLDKFFRGDCFKNASDENKLAIFVHEGIDTVEEEICRENWLPYLTSELKAKLREKFRPQEYGLNVGRAVSLYDHYSRQRMYSSEYFDIETVAFFLNDMGYGVSSLVNDKTNKLMCTWTSITSRWAPTQPVDIEYMKSMEDIDGKKLLQVPFSWLNFPDEAEDSAEHNGNSADAKNQEKVVATDSQKMIFSLVTSNQEAYDDCSVVSLFSVNE